MNSTLIVATHNTHKTGEIREMLGGFFEEVVDLTAFPEIPEADETGTTFSENAAIKAIEASAAIPEALVLADDSGLEVDALDGAPGVYSARYSGEDATDESNRVKLLEELAKAGAKGKKRSGRFRCLLCLACGGVMVDEFDGSVEGIIANEEKGKNGFGYDPLFIPEGHCETFGQLPSETKHGLSHRGRALEKLKVWLKANR
ncbi:MAG: RdgB/HAM1 family non-canonical purine NTP pyrophosphatase [Verrucomicrobiales bacterium]|nr:RdgB/HAM1 family non-canonical purine NTP pyrophosphatase [Verrucomicrobiales bacterium]